MSKVKSGEIKWHGKVINKRGDGRLRTLQINRFFFSLLCFSGPHLWHLEVPRLGVKSELQLSAYATATATPDLSHVCNLYHSSWECWIPHPLSQARDWTRILMDTSWVQHHWATMGTPQINRFLAQGCSSMASVLILYSYHLLAQKLKKKLCNLCHTWMRGDLSISPSPSPPPHTHTHTPTPPPHIL